MKRKTIFITVTLTNIIILLLSFFLPFFIFTPWKNKNWEHARLGNLEFEDKIIYQLVNTETSFTSSDLLQETYKNNVNKFINYLKLAIAKKEFSIFLEKVKGIYQKSLQEQKWQELIDLLTEWEIFNLFTKKSNIKTSPNDNEISYHNALLFEEELWQKGLNIYQADDWFQLGTNKIKYDKDCDLNRYLINKNIQKEDISNSLDKFKHQNLKQCSTILEDRYNKRDLENNGNHQIYNPFFSSPNLVSSPEEYYKTDKNWSSLLHIRYQDYINEEIILNIANKIFNITYLIENLFLKNKNKISLNENSVAANQLQDWSNSEKWDTKFRLVWEYKRDSRNPSLKPEIPLIGNDINWTAEKLFLDKLNYLYDDFESRDPIFRLNGFVNSPKGKKYGKAAQGTKMAKWLWRDEVPGKEYYERGIYHLYAFALPIYLIDVVKNLSFNNTAVSINKEKWLYWTVENKDISSDPAKKFVRNLSDDNKEKIIFQMLFDISENKDNSTQAAKYLFPKYLPAKEINNSTLWKKISDYYSEKDKKDPWWWLPWHWHRREQK